MHITLYYLLFVSNRFFALFTENCTYQIYVVQCIWALAKTGNKANDLLYQSVSFIFTCSDLLGH